MHNWPIKYKPGAKPNKSNAQENQTQNEKGIKRKISDGFYEKEKRQVREFNPDWMKNRDWLIFDKEKNVMKCTMCIKFYETNESARTSCENLKYTRFQFVAGSKNFKLGAIHDHERTSTHMRVVQMKRAKENPDETPAAQGLYSLNMSQQTLIELKIRNVHAIVKNNRPLRDFIWLTELDHAKGCDVGNTYNNEKAAAMFLRSIAGTERDKMRDLVQRANFFSLTMDGTTDESCKEQESLFLRTCNKGKRITRFLCIGEPKDTTATGLFDFVKQKLHENNILPHMNKMVGFGSDGAATMIGKKGGLITLIKKDYPWIIGVHCLAHRLELAYRDAVSKNANYDKLVTMLLGIYYFYRRSSKQRKALKATFQVLSVNGTLPHRVGGTRWVPHMRKALDSMFRGFEAYLSHLENESHSNAKAGGLANMIGSFNMVAFALLLQDILEPLVRLSLTLQSEEVTLADIHLMVNATLKVLEQTKDRNSPSLQDLIDTKTFHGRRLSQKGKSLDVGKTKGEIIERILTAIEKRFSDMSNELQPTLIGSLKNWPENESEDFGNEHIRVLGERFRECFDSQEIYVEDMIAEWRLLKALVYDKYGDKLQSTKWSTINTDFQYNGLENILCLIDLILTLPPTSVVNETGFNQLKLIKSDRRQKLGEERLNDLMLTKLESPDIAHFDPGPAFRKWLITDSGQHRRGGYQRESASATAIQEEQEERNEEQEEEHNSNQEMPSVSNIPPQLAAENVQSCSAFEMQTSDGDSDAGYESEFEFEQSEKVNSTLLAKYSQEH